jgi:hypothetical protein
MIVRTNPSVTDVPLVTKLKSLAGHTKRRGHKKAPSQLVKSTEPPETVEQKLHQQEPQLPQRHVPLKLMQSPKLMPFLHVGLQVRLVQPLVLLVIGLDQQQKHGQSTSCNASN